MTTRRMTNILYYPEYGVTPQRSTVVISKNKLLIESEVSVAVVWCKRVAI
ncbi:MAG: hypothetical protein ACFFFG_14535 [Candidatus Thorarchaeota archaeon]